MDIFSSRMDVNAVEEIETNVVDLIIRLGEEEGKICYIVKDQLLRALQVYTNLIEKETKKGCISQHKSCRMKKVISRAINKLQNFEASHKNVTNTLCTFGKKLHQMKNAILKIEKQIKHNQIKEHEYETALKVITVYSLELQQGNKWPLNSQEQADSVAVLFLKLFLKSPCTKISTIIKKILSSLSETAGDFDMFNKQEINSFNAEEINANLRDVKSKLDLINRLTSERMEAKNRKRKRKVKRNFSETLDQNSTNNDVKLVKKILEELKECASVTQQLRVPIANETVTTLKNKVTHLVKIQLGKVNGNTVEMAREKMTLNRNGRQILDDLENIDKINKQFHESLKKLKEIEKNVYAVVEADMKIEEKKKILDSLLIDVTNNDEILIQKTEILNRIEGLLTLETADYLRQMKKTIDHHKMYAQQFAFPKQVGLFKWKSEEICSLKNRFNELSRGNEYIDKRMYFLYRNIDKVLSILETKAESNQQLILMVEILDGFEQEIVQIDSTSTKSVKKLRRFNKIREKMNLITSLNMRVISKKRKICSLIQSIEERIFVSKYPGVIREIKSVLNAHENDVQQFIHPLGCESYRKKRKAILALMENVRRNSGDYKFMQELLNTFSLVVELLDNTYKVIKARNNSSEKLKSILNDIINLSKSDLSPSKKIEFFGPAEEALKSIKINAYGSDELSNNATGLESIVHIERSKVELSQCLTKVRQLKMDIASLSRPIGASTFNEKLSQILFLKDVVEDMPEGYEELDLQKQTASQEIFNALQLLDEDLAKATKSRKKSENILDLQNPFSNFNPDGLGFAKNSLEFVQMIRGRAETFEDSVKFYLGTNSSVDYDIIHENLLRLLGELNNVTCQNDEKLLSATVEAMGYIKRLVEALSSNASSD